MATAWFAISIVLVPALLPLISSAPVLNPDITNDALIRLEKDFWAACFGTRWLNGGGGGFNGGGNVGGGGFNAGGNAGGGVNPGDVEDVETARQMRRMSRNRATPARQTTKRQMASTKNARQTASNGARSAKQTASRRATSTRNRM